MANPIKSYKEAKDKIIKGYKETSENAKQQGIKMGEQRVRNRQNGNENEPTVDSAIDAFKNAYGKSKEMPTWKIILYGIVFLIVLFIVLLGIIFR